jgi:hypothetical protein
MVAANVGGEEIDIWPTVDWVLRGVRPDGRIVAAEGFGRIVPVFTSSEHLADELGVVGWVDKGFRALAALAGPDRVASSGPTVSQSILVQGMTQ